MRNTTLKGMLAAIACSILPLMKTNAQSFSEPFNDITTLAGSGWAMTNASVAVGSTGWFQGNPVSAMGPFDSYNGAANAYIGANYNNTGSTGTISNWLMTPNRTFRNGDVLTFYTRKPSPDSFADRLEVRLSTNGASTNVGTGAGTGDYTTLLLSVNPNLVLGVYPTTWTMYTITISGLPAPTSGRIAFRYFVISGGLNGTNSDYIGIDQVDYMPYVCPAITVGPASLPNGAAGTAYSQSLSQTGALGTPGYAITAGALPPGLTLSASGTISGTPAATGTFNFTVTVSDASGCSGAQAYSITTVCGANPTSLNGLPSLCADDAPITLTQGLPGGGTYSGTGVSGGVFDPAAGTQTITYDYTDPYGCSYSTSNTIAVNPAASASWSPLVPVCSNIGPFALSGGSPAGGVYSGTGVSGGSFDPSNGTQTLTYTYTDANGCSASATQAITVNTAPVVTQSPFAAQCSNSGMLTLSGGAPAGGTYSGTGVSGASFDPASGTQTLFYSYTDANGCTNSTSFTVVVNTAPSVTQSPFAAVCADAPATMLSGGSPAGGVYSGVGVSGNIFDPSAGTQTITYTYTDVNNCTNSSAMMFTVHSLPNTTLSLPVSTMCVYHNPITLSGGSPSGAGGAYSGAGVSGGTFNPSVAGLGSHTITYEFTDGNECTASATDNIVVDDCLGVEENELFTLSAYPNPGDGLFTISLNEGQLFSDVVVADVEGRLVERVGVTNQTEAVIIDLTQVQSGVYFLNGSLDGERVSVRLIKQ